MITGAAASAQKTCARSAPHRSAAIAAKYGAPVYSAHPPITATFPRRPLCAVGSSGAGRNRRASTETDVGDANGGSRRESGSGGGGSGGAPPAARAVVVGRARSRVIAGDARRAARREGSARGRAGARRDVARRMRRRRDARRRVE